MAGRLQRLVAWVLDALVACIVFLPLNPALYHDPASSLVLTLTTASTIGAFAYLIAFDGGRRGATPGKLS